MIALIIFLVIVTVFVFAKRNEKDSNAPAAAPTPPAKPLWTYSYKRKQHIMTKSENDFFDVLQGIIGDKYWLFPQVRLSAVLDHKDTSHGYQNWDHALAAINQKSVDYVVCDRATRAPLLVIELDDWSHERPNRQERDAKVEAMLQKAGLPIARFRNVKTISQADITSQLSKHLALSAPPIGRTSQL